LLLRTPASWYMSHRRESHGRVSHRHVSHRRESRGGASHWRTSLTGCISQACVLQACVLEAFRFSIWGLGKGSLSHRVGGYRGICHGTDRHCWRTLPEHDDFAGNLLPSQPASICHGGLWLYLLHLLHRPEPPYACRGLSNPARLPGLSTVPPTSTKADSDSACSTWLHRPEPPYACQDYRPSRLA
jgi:hypothetical protein